MLRADTLMPELLFRGARLRFTRAAFALSAMLFSPAAFAAAAPLFATNTRLH